MKYVKQMFCIGLVWLGLARSFVRKRTARAPNKLYNTTQYHAIPIRCFAAAVDVGYSIHHTIYHAYCIINLYFFCLKCFFFQ